MSKQCINRVGFFKKVYNHHEYEHIYDLKETYTFPDWFSSFRIKGDVSLADKIIESYKIKDYKKIYIKSICRYCGHTIYRDKI